MAEVPFTPPEEITKAGQRPEAEKPQFSLRESVPPNNDFLKPIAEVPDDFIGGRDENGKFHRISEELTQLGKLSLNAYQLELQRIAEGISVLDQESGYGADAQLRGSVTVSPVPALDSRFVASFSTTNILKDNPLRIAGSQMLIDTEPDLTTPPMSVRTGDYIVEQKEGGKYEIVGDYKKLYGEHKAGLPGVLKERGYKKLAEISIMG